VTAVYTRVEIGDMKEALARAHTRVFYDVDTRAMQVIVRAVRRKGRSTTREIP